MDLSNIINVDSNFYINDPNKRGASYYSLKIALESYFSTYDVLRHKLREDINGIDRSAINSAVEGDTVFIQNSINIWIHLQHFFELEIKRLLENIDERLLVKASDDKLYCKNVLNISIEDKDYTRNSIGFSEALYRFLYLQSENRINCDFGEIIKNHKNDIEFINKMRNSTVHRAKRVLTYCMLDDVMSGGILPLIKEIVLLPEYESYNIMFDKNKTLDILLDSIINEGQKDTIDYSKIALYKEYARCAKNNRKGFGQLGLSDKQKIKSNVEIIKVKHLYASDTLYKCPNCNQKSLVEIYELVDEYEGKREFGVDELECAYCGFHINNFFNLLSSFSYKN